MRYLALATVAWLALTTGPAVSPAQGDGDAAAGRPGDRKEALRRLASGDRKLGRGDKLAARGKIEQAFAEFEAALNEYQAAHRAYADPQIFFPIAQAEQRLGRFVDALQHYQQLLELASELTPAVKAQVQVQLNEVKKNLAAVLLEVEPAGAAIRIDGREVAISPMSQPVFVEPGIHTLRVSRSGHTAVEDKVDLAPGVELRRRIRLEPASVATGPDDGDRGGEPVVPVPADQRDRGPGRPSALPVWIGVGLTGALVVGGTVTGLAAVSMHGQFSDDTRSDAAREEARRDGERMAGITDIMWGGAIVAGGVTAYYYFAHYRPRSAEAERLEGRDGDESVRLLPLLGDGTAGVAASLTF